MGPPAPPPAGSGISGISSRSGRRSPLPSLAHGLLLFLLVALFIRPAAASLTVPTAPAAPQPSVFYDAFSTRIYDPTGRVLQLEYALEATRKGGAAVGAVAGGAAGLACLASWTPRFSRRMAPAAQQPALGIWHGDAHVALVASGMATDAMALAELARRECRAHRYIYDGPVGVGRLAARLAQALHETERQRIVPYAVDLLLAGYSEGEGPCLYNLGPAGVYTSYRTCAVGRKAAAARAKLEAALPAMERLELEASVEGEGTRLARLQRLAELALRALMATVDDEGGALHGAGEGKEEEGDESPELVTEDVSLVVVGRGVPATALDVTWEPRRRRIEIKVPKALAAMLEGE